VPDVVGTGNKWLGSDGRRVNGVWENCSGGPRDESQKSIWENFKGRRHAPIEGEGKRQALKEPGCLHNQNHHGSDTQEEEQQRQLEKDLEQDTKPDKPIFRNLCIYVNGSTMPLISDHKLKHLLAKHGATLSIALGRRSVTHVIVGNTVSNGGAGGGLAGSKIQKEITRVRGKGIKFVTAEWAVESIKAGKKLNEAQFSNTKLVAPSGQKSVLGMFKSVKPGQSATQDKKG